MPKLIFFNKNKIEKDSDNFWHRKLTLKVRKWLFLIAWFRAGVDLTKYFFYEKVLFLTQCASCSKNLKCHLMLNDPLYLIDRTVLSWRHKTNFQCKITWEIVRCMKTLSIYETNTILSYSISLKAKSPFRQNVIRFGFFQLLNLLSHSAIHFTL